MECPVCLERYTPQAPRRPVVFPQCGHTVCEVCVERLYQGSTPLGRPTCPSCRTPLPANPAELLLNYALVSLLSEVSSRQRRPRRHHISSTAPHYQTANGELQCGTHTGQPIQTFCVHCETFVCTTCCSDALHIRLPLHMVHAEGTFLLNNLIEELMSARTLATGILSILPKLQTQHAIIFSKAAADADTLFAARIEQLLQQRALVARLLKNLADDWYAFWGALMIATKSHVAYIEDNLDSLFKTPDPSITHPPDEPSPSCSDDGSASQRKRLCSGIPYSPPLSFSEPSTSVDPGETSPCRARDSNHPDVSPASTPPEFSLQTLSCISETSRATSPYTLRSLSLVQTVGTSFANAPPLITGDESMGMFLEALQKLSINPGSVLVPPLQKEFPPNTTDPTLRLRLHEVCGALLSHCQAIRESTRLCPEACHGSPNGDFTRALSTAPVRPSRDAYHKAERTLAKLTRAWQIYKNIETLGKRLGALKESENRLLHFLPYSMPTDNAGLPFRLSFPVVHPSHQRCAIEDVLKIDIETQQLGI